MKTTDSPTRAYARNNAPTLPPLQTLAPAASEVGAARTSTRDRQSIGGIRQADFLNPLAGRDDASHEQEDRPVRIRVADPSAHPHLSQQIASLKVARQMGAVTGIRVSVAEPGPEAGAASPPLVVIEMQPAATPAALSMRTVTHVVAPWHRQERTAGHGRAGNALLGLGVAGLVTGLVCTQAWSCSDDGHAASGAASLGTAAGLAIGGLGLEYHGLRPLEKPMLRLHQGLRQLWATLRRPSATEQLRAIVDEARQSPLTPDGLEAVLDRCADILAGHSRAEALASGWGPLVLTLIPGATGRYSGPMADRIQSFVAGFTGE